MDSDSTEGGHATIKKSMHLSYPNFNGRRATGGGLAFLALLDGTVAAFVQRKIVQKSRNTHCWAPLAQPQLIIPTPLFSCNRLHTPRVLVGVLAALHLAVLADRESNLGHRRKIGRSH